MKTPFLHSLLGLACCVSLLLMAPKSEGEIIGLATENLDGTFTYRYSVDNSKGTFDIFAWSLELDIFSDWDMRDTFAGGDVIVPSADWFADSGFPIGGIAAQDFLTLAGGDVLMGDILGGFEFTSRYVPGVVRYHEFEGTVGLSANGLTLGPTMIIPESVRGAWIVTVLCGLTATTWWRGRNFRETGTQGG